jgi:hypothetical protein
MNTVQVWTDDGETWVTSFNGTEQEAINYFLGSNSDRWNPYTQKEEDYWISAVRWWAGNPFNGG